MNRILPFFVFLFACVSIGSAKADLILNPSFEEPDLAGDFQDFVAGSGVLGDTHGTGSRGHGFSGTHTERSSRVDRDPRGSTIHLFGGERMAPFRPLPAETSHGSSETFIARWSP